MNRLIHLTWFTALASLAVSLKPHALAKSTARYELTWSTLDGGGSLHSSGGRYELGSTIGQPDAGQLAGGRYELAGGFWSGGRLVTLPAMSGWAALGLLLLLFAAGCRRTARAAASDVSGLHQSDER